MGYQASYRRYRPQDFDQLVGQQHVVTTLQNALLAGQVAHAYLFTGPRGTGKTSVARILAKAVNCERAPTANPCNQCDSCRAVNNGTALDVIEIDAASNRGIDDIRDLREKVSLAPAGGRKKVYIIDEVHMLTAEAFNALLKTLEEPPGHVIFILATTEPQKVPLTIASRCQRFDFHRLDVSQIVPRLVQVATAAQSRLTPEAAALIAQRADGALRDALSLLDQCLVFGGSEITADVVHSVLGTLRGDELKTATDAIQRGDVRTVLLWLQHLLDSGRDPAQVAQDLGEHFRTLLWARTMGHTTPMPGWTESAWADLCRQAEPWPLGRLAEAMRVLVAVENDIRRAAQPRLMLETAIVQISLQKERVAEVPVQPESRTAAASIATAPLARQGTLAAGGTPATAGSVTADPATAGPAIVPNQAAPSVPAPGAMDLDTVRAKWPQVLETLRRNMNLRAMVVEGQVVEVSRQSITLAYRRTYRLHKETVEKPENRRKVEEAIAAVLRVPLELVVTYRDEAADTERASRDPPSSQVTAPVNDSVPPPAETVSPGQETDAAVLPPAREVAPAGGHAAGGNGMRRRARPGANHARIGSKPTDPLEQLARDLFDGQVVDLLEIEKKPAEEGHPPAGGESMVP